MQRDAANALYSATDLINFLSCVHSTALDLLCVGDQLEAPDADDDAYLALLKDKGLDHERQYLESIRAKGRSVREIQESGSLDTMAEATRQAMRDGVDVIYQGALVARPWHGYSDFLLKVPRPSKLGAYSYEVADTKLARSAKPKHVIQLCLYSELVALEQGLLPGNAHVMLGDGTQVTLRLNDYRYYCQAAQERFRDFVSGADRCTEAEPCHHCEMCRWGDRCEHEWQTSDHLSLVASIGRTQRKRLCAAGVTTLTALAHLDHTAVPRLQPETLDRLRSQARLQLHKRTTNENRFELLPLQPRRGFARLPEPDEGDLFFDMEGDPVYSMDGSLEYLFGFQYLDEGEERFTAFWAHNREEERKAFEDAVDFITARLAKHSKAYIYHYASYEEVALRKLAQKYGAASALPVVEEDPRSALKRLAQEYGTRENEVDDLLRGRKLVDLYKVVREGVRVSEPSYSLKNLEVFFAPERTQTIKSGGDSIVVFERWLVLRDDALLKQIEEYNAVDCKSTQLCHDWLLGLRPPAVAWFNPAAQAQEDAENDRERDEKRREHDARILALRTALMRDQPPVERSWRELLGYLLEYHRREARREWWEYFERLDKSREQLIDDGDCIGGLRTDRSVAPRQDRRSMVWTLCFPEQDTKLRARDTAVRVDTGERLEIVSLDESTCRLELKLGPSRQPLADDIALIPQGPRDDRVQREAIERYAQAVIDGREGEFAAVTSILRKDKSRLRDGPIIRPESKDLLSATGDAIRRMDRTHLLIQGPPGSGKTFTSAHAIVDLLASGKRIGVTALSHKAINNLLRRVEEVAVQRGVKFTGMKKSSDDDEQAFRGSIIKDTQDNDVALHGGHDLIAGTAWLFSRPDAEGLLDYLFVDEAGQLSLANVVATGLSAKNIVLIGDPMQLSQPIKGAHPGGSGVSVMGCLMGGLATVPPDRGIFLDRTWRMHPALCRFVSEAFYDSRLQAIEDTAKQRVSLSSECDGAIAPFGLRFVAVEHADNAQKSAEEGERLNAVYRELLGQLWINADGVENPIGLEDILVVSPYNMQVNLLKSILPKGARVGTVDKFQGQEAAVVLISMASSSGELIPRGIEFLFSPNRLNVALSRARCLSVVFASARLLGTACRTIEQLHQVNTLCWIKAVSNQ
jgi:predicted RecB family nuclease